MPRFSRHRGLLLVLAVACIATTAMAAPPSYVPGQVLIKFKSHANSSERGAIMRDLHARSAKHFDLIGADLLVLDSGSVENAIGRYRNNPKVEYVEPNYVLSAFFTPNDPRFPEMYGLRNTGQTGGTPGADIKAAQAWDLFTGDPNLLVGVIDTGVDYNHPDLAANIWTNPGEIPGNSIDDDGNGYVDDVHGYDFVNNDGDPFDDHGHGSHTSGTIGAVGNNAVGVVGVNWNIKIVGLKFLNSSGSGSTEGAIAAIQYATRLTQAGFNLRLTSNSWGGGGFSQALLDAINAAGAAGQLFVAAAGNSSQNTDTTPSYPASYNTPYIIAVAATDHNDNLASFSNYGATTVDLAAPGVDILSTFPGNTYGSISGTSMATPHVAGAAALTWGRFPALTNLQVKDLILNHVDVKSQLAGKCLTGGRLNAFMAIAEPDSSPPGQITNLATSDAASNSIRLTWTATGDDGNTGRAVKYEIRYSTSPITPANFGSATLVAGPDPRPAGQAESFEVTGLAFSTTYWFAIKAFDEFNNAGAMSNTPTGTTLGIPDIAATPPSFTAEMLTGGTETQTLTLRNDAAGTLDFTVPTPQIEFAQPVVHEPIVVEKGQPDLRVGDPVLQGHGGPDGFGYRWVDSDDPGGPAYSWVDITGIGTPVALTGDDATSSPIAMGMSFPFYGNTFTDVRVCTNGFLSFTDAATSYGNQPLPTSGAPANLLAPFWDDLNFGTVQRAYTHGDGTRFIVSWIAVPSYTSGEGPYTFQVILYPTGEIRYQYETLGVPTNNCTVGLQNATKTIGLTVAYNTTYLHDNMAVRVAPLAQWLTVSPTSGRILAGQSLNLNVVFNALGLEGGGFDATIHVLSNDPDEGDVALPAHLHVIGAPDIAVSPASLDYGEVFVGATLTRTIAVSNPGTDDLVVTGITSSHASLTASPTSFTLHPKASQNVVATWHPTAVMTLNATLTIASNDPDTPNKVVTAVGSAVPAPSFSVNPTSFDVSLLTNTATSRNLRITNSGGSNYVWTAESMVQSASGTVTVYSDADNVDLAKGAPDEQFGPEPLRSGGPDVFGYTYKDSDEPGGPTFGWVDVRTLGTQINLTGDDANSGALPIGFSFPFYGKTFSNFRVCTNGWVSFTSSATSYNNTALPNTGSGTPENLLAVFWDDMNFVSPNKRAYYYNDGSKLVIQYQDVGRYGDTTHPNTFEIILYPNGTVVYQYLSMTATLKNSATIGMQNEAKNDGLQVVYNANYVHDALAIRFMPPARFLTVTPTGGTVPAGGFVDLTVGFNASGLFGGVYNGAVRIRGNDPVVPQLDVPAILRVTGVPDITATPTSLNFGNVFVGYPKLLQMQVSNVGTDALIVSNITSSDPAYGPDATSFTVPPLGSSVLTVSFNPPAAGPRPATLTIASNDPDTPNLVIGLAGTGLIPPDVSTTPTSLASTLNIPASELQTLTVHNTGGSDLNFTTGALITAASVPQYEPLDLGKDEIDTRPGVLGSGGPDVFGYTWRDSDEPGGPVFDWVDITGVGTLLALNGDDQNLPGVAIGFSFPFYGNTFTTVNLCSNGWLSFTNTSNSLSNSPLPSTGAPENLVAMFWDDLDFRATSGSGRAYAHNDGTRFIVSYLDVPHYTSTGTGLYSFQVILYPSGKIVYQYLDMQGTLNSATIGIQNAAKNDGLNVVANNAYVHNNLAIVLQTLPDWLTVAPTTGTIPASGSMDLQVTFDSNGLFGGDYTGAVRITSNDPDEGALDVPATLHATGVPHIAAVPTSLDFGWLYLSQTRDLVLKLRNVGTDVLHVSGGSISNPVYSIVSGSFPVTLGQSGVASFTLRFAPTAACDPCTGTLTVTSDDPDMPTLTVPLTGKGVVPPEIDTQPTALKAALATTLGPTAIAKTKTLIVRNTGGSDLTWSAQAYSKLLASLNVPVNGESAKGDPGTPGQPTVMANGGPDAFGYRWADSDDPSGTPIDWVDITGLGTPIPFTGDDQNMGPYPLPFPFTYYGNTYTSFRACSNGWISFTSTLTAYTNTTLPNSGSSVPENVLAAFWDDLTFSTTGDAYYYYDGTKFIISYVAVPHLGSGGPYTFQILLYPSGTIDFQYLDMQGTRLNEATIGIQNATKDVGLQVVYNAAYVENNLRIRFTSLPGWLTVSPPSGVVPAGQQVALQVGFDASRLADGDYTGLVRISSNDLDEPTVDVPCDLHVGVMTAMFRVEPNTLNQSSQGNWVSGSVTLSAGHDAHKVLTPSVLVQRTVPVAPGAPISYGDGNLVRYKFSRSALIDILPAGSAVTVEVIGEEGDVSWFAGTDVIRVIKPKVDISTRAKPTADGATIAGVVAGSELPITWQDPEGYPATSYELWFSPDGGESWSLVAGNLTEHAYTWTVPQTPVESARLELVALDAQGAMGSWMSEPFAITKPVDLPTSFGLRAASNPARGTAMFRVAVPQQANVDLKVYDVKGAVVRHLSSKALAAGYHSLAWDGRDGSGRPVAAGVYFVRMTAGDRQQTVRLLLVH